MERKSESDQCRAELVGTHRPRWPSTIVVRTGMPTTGFPVKSQRIQTHSEAGVLSLVESLRLTPYTLSSVAALARLELGIVSRLQAGTRDRVRTERQVPWAGPPDNYATLMSQLSGRGPGWRV